jgi:hypothetical protein
LTHGLQLDKSPRISSTTAESTYFILGNFGPKSVAKAAQSNLAIGITFSLADVLIEVVFGVQRIQDCRTGTSSFLAMFLDIPRLG